MEAGKFEEEAGKGMAAWKRRKEVEYDTRKPLGFFWRDNSENKASIETARRKTTSGGAINKRAKVQASTESSKENKAPTVDKGAHQRRPSLKDLCPEDKHRVKQLIEQLARTSSEKEAMEDKVKEERRQFTVLLDKLKKQHHKVVKEKKDIQSLESELHASQLQLQAIHTYPPSNNTPQLTHLHVGVSTANAIPAGTAESKGPGIPPIAKPSVETRNLAMVSQPPILATSLSQLPQREHSTFPTFPPLHHSRHDTVSKSSRTIPLPSIQASYPAYFTASSNTTTCNYASVSNDHTQRGSIANPPTLMESLSTTSINQGVPLSSTHVQHSQQELCLGNRPPCMKVDPPSSLNCAMTGRGGDCCSQEIPSIVHLVAHNDTTGPEQQYHQARLSPKQGEQTSIDKVNTTAKTEPATPPIPVPMRQHWLSLPSATPEQHSSLREGISLQKDDDSVGGTCREIGTQTLYVESVATQTDLDGEERDNPPTSPAIRRLTNVLSSSPSLTKRIVDSTAMSTGDLHTTAPSDTPQANVKPSFRDSLERTPKQDQGRYDGHRAPVDLNQLNSEDVLLEELLTTSFLLNGQGVLAGDLTGSQESTEFRSTSKEAESVSPFELAASLNSLKDPSPQPLLTFQRHEHSHKDPNYPPLSFCQHEHSHPSSMTRLSTTLSENTPPRYTNYPYYYRDWETDTRQGGCLDDSKLIEELFFI